MDWEGIFGGLSPASFFNFSFLGEYGVYILQALGYTLLLAVVSVLPPTGDQTNLPLYLTLAAAALLLAAVLRRARKRREQKQE